MAGFFACTQQVLALFALGGPFAQILYSHAIAFCKAQCSLRGCTIFAKCHPRWWTNHFLGKVVLPFGKPQNRERESPWGAQGLHRRKAKAQFAKLGFAVGL